MPKMKTHRGAAKRFGVTATGKITRRKAFGSHILEKKSSKRKRCYRGTHVLAEADAPKVRRLIGH
ncbi:MAG: 50S ribosomal protein L35 [Candidatus Geothermincolia bacterium]